MKAFQLARAFGGVFALVLAGALYANAGVVIPRPSVSGPSLGDPTTNLDSIVQGLQNDTFTNFYSYTTLTVAAGQTTSTIINYGMNFLTAAVGVTATIVLPTARPGAELYIANNTGVGVAVFGSASPFTPGGNDYINNVNGGTVAATPPYSIGTSNVVVNCFVPQGGNWWCQSGK